jgi:hypothetical protein
MSLREIVLMIHQGEYGRAITSLEHEFRDEYRSPQEKLEYCRWLAECNQRVGDNREAGNWYVEAVRVVLSGKRDTKMMAKEALPLCEKALEAYEKGGDPADVLVAARLKQYLLGLGK